MARPQKNYRGEDGIQCCHCQQIKPLEAYTAGESRTCKVCKRGRYYQRQYGLSSDAYNALLESQGGMCKVCRDRSAVYVDHDHTTGQVRGLLCPMCNTLLGFIEDKKDRVLSLLDYLAP